MYGRSFNSPCYCELCWLNRLKKYEITIIDAASPYYGTPNFSNLSFKDVKCPVYCYFAENDDKVGFSAPEDGKKLEQILKDDGVNVTLS